MFAVESHKTKESRTPQWFKTVAQIAAVVSIPIVLCTVWLNIADQATLQSSAFMAGLREPQQDQQKVVTRSLIGAALTGTQSAVLPVYEALYPAQTTQYVALLLLPGLIDELQGDVRSGHMAYIIDERLPVVVREYVHEGPLCSTVQEKLILAAIQQTSVNAVDVCRPVSAVSEQRLVEWLTGQLQRGFDTPEPSVQGIIYPLRVETSERLGYTRFARYARYSAILVLVLWGAVVVLTGLNWHRSMRWLGVVCVCAGILGVSFRAVTESGQVFDGTLVLQQYSRQAAWSGLPLGVLLRVLVDTSFRDWSIISACVVLFVGTAGVGIGALQKHKRPMLVGELTPMEGVPLEYTPPHPSITAIVPTATVTAELPAGLVTNPLEIIRDEFPTADMPSNR